MKILLLADEPEPMLWEHLKKERLKDIDLILSCGDLPAAYLSFLTCFCTAPILYVRGNHDDRYDKHPPEGCICIEDKLYVIDGVRILGLGGSMRYKEGVNQYTERQMARRAARLSWTIRRRKGFDILLTHAPAYQLGDDTDLCHRGFDTFRRLMHRYKPAYMVHGHVHKSYTPNFIRTRTFEDTQVINAYGSYVIELPGRAR